tara:strand:+ start:171 stop:629 length:459 start_codon:yes stop_codon:yes gene_type:complete
MTILSELSIYDGCYQHPFLQETESVVWHLPYEQTGYNSHFGYRVVLPTEKLNAFQLDEQKVISAIYLLYGLSLVEVATKDLPDAIMLFVRMRCESTSDEADGDQEFAKAFGNDLMQMDVEDTLRLPPGHMNMTPEQIAQYHSDPEETSDIEL